MEVQCPFKIPEQHLRPADLFQAVISSAKRYGNRLALADASTGWSCTFDEIERCVNSCRQYFHRLGISSDHRPAVIVLNCPELVLTQLASSVIGFDLIHASPLATVGELAGCLTIAKCDLILTDPEHRAKMERVLQTVPSCKRIVLLPEQASLLARIPTPAYGTRPTKVDRQAHMVFFSSGTTGLPKAFQMPQELVAVNVIQGNAAPWNRLEAESKTQERTLMVIPLTHAYALSACYFALCKGHAVITTPRFAPEKFLVALEKYQITYLHLVPPLVSFLASDDSVSQYDLSHLHSVTSAAAPLPANVAAKCKDRLGLKDMRQLYGMTEIRACTWTPYGHTNYMSIGVPLPGVVVKLVDPDSNTTVTKPYDHGELWVSGPHTGGTYFENELANRETFVFEDGVSWCKTGDIGYFDTLGYLYLTDRRKDVIKCKGLQVSPSEIESILREHPGVVDCAVIGKPDEQAGEVPVAFVKRKHGSLLTAEILKELVRSRLSSYKQLSGGVVFLDELPRSNTGKTLKRQLRELLPHHVSKL